MKRSVAPKRARNSVNRPWLLLKGEKKKAFLASVKQLQEQCDRLGLLDPTDIEPAVVYMAQAEKE